MSAPEPVWPHDSGPCAWVVFSGDADLPWLRLLKAGFRHCFVVLNDGSHWITVDPLSPFTEVAVQPVPAEFDLPAWFAGQGLTVVPAAVRRDLARPAPWAPFTCVEVVKRVLGIQDRWALTPWQLYQRLAREDDLRWAAHAAETAQAAEPRSPCPIDHQPCDRAACEPCPREHERQIVDAEIAGTFAARNAIGRDGGRDPRAAVLGVL